MGWINEDKAPGHEGYVVGLVPLCDDRWRELRYPNDKITVLHLKRVQVACTCGWRSQVLHAPIGTRFDPYCVSFSDERYDDDASRMWDHHVTNGVRQGGLVFVKP